MELFTKNLKTQSLITILETQLHISKPKVKCFENTPEMCFILFSFEGLQFNLIHHFQAERYSFRGSLLNLQLDSMAGVSYKDEHQEVFEKIMNAFINTLGGVSSPLGSSEFLEGFDSPSEDQSFLLGQLKLAGVSSDDISDELNKILDKTQRSKKSNC